MALVVKQQEQSENTAATGALVKAPGLGGELSRRCGEGGGLTPRWMSGVLTVGGRRQAPKVPVPQWHAPWKLKSVISGHLGYPQRKPLQRLGINPVLCADGCGPSPSTRPTSGS